MESHFSVTCFVNSLFYRMTNVNACFTAKMVVANMETCKHEGNVYTCRKGDIIMSPIAGIFFRKASSTTSSAGF